MTLYIIIGDNMNDYLVTLSFLYNGDYFKIYNHLKYNKKTFVNQDVINLLTKHKIKTITILDEIYPNILKTLAQPPFVLFYKGDIKLLNETSYGVIGTRTPSSYGISLTRKFIPLFKNRKINIVSGMALGIDGLAHKMCKLNNIKTIGVLGSGFFNIYPKQNVDLAYEIDLLITEYPPHVKPLKHHFPMRNRIVAAQSKKLIIIEAKKKSGTLITADIANDLGKDIYCIPGDITHENSYGCNKLISEGAYILYDFNEIFNNNP